MLPMVSVVVPAKNEEKVIENCIKSLLKVNYPKDRLEIVIATDKNNTDRTIEVCKKYEPRIKIILTKETHCKAEALNYALPKLKGEIIAFYDADCIVEKNCIMNAVKRFEDEKVMTVMGFIKPYNINQNIISKLVSLETCMVFFQDYLLSKFGYNVNIVGRNMFIRKKVFEKIHGFDEYSYLEDVEFSAELRKYNFKTVLEKNAITHDECPNSISDVLNQGLRFFRGLIRIKRKETFEDFVHGFNVYLNSISSFMLFILLTNLFIKISFINFLALAVIVFHFLFVSIANYVFKQPMKNLILFPIFLLFFYMNFYIIAKAWYYERTNKPMKWYRTKRTGVLTK